MKARAASLEEPVLRAHFRGLKSETRRCLKDIRALGRATGERKTDEDTSKAMLAAVDQLVEAGVSRIGALSFCLAQPQKPLLGKFLRDKRLSHEERVEILGYFVKKESKVHYPTLDLSCQGLFFVPPEITEVTVPAATISGDTAYREINLGYNPIRKLNATDYQRLNRFEGIHLMATKLAEINKDVRALDNAIMLNFSWTAIKKLPPEIYELKRLRSLRLNWTNVTLKRDIKKLTNLKSVQLCETPTLEALYQIEGMKLAAMNTQQKEAREVRQILNKMHCSIEE